MIFTSECAINFTIRIARIVLTGHADSVEIREDVQKRDAEWIHREMKKLIWTREEPGTHERKFVRLMIGWYVDPTTGKNHLIYPAFQTHYWLRTVFPRLGNFEIVGARGWLGFYFGLLRGKLKRNKWTLTVLAACVGWYVSRGKSS